MTAKQNRIWLTLGGIVMAAVAVQHSGEPWFLYPCLLFAALFFVNAWISWNPRWFRLAKTVYFFLWPYGYAYISSGE